MFTYSQVIQRTNKSGLRCQQVVDRRDKKTPLLNVSEAGPSLAPAPNTTWDAGIDGSALLRFNSVTVKMHILANFGGSL